MTGGRGVVSLPDAVEIGRVTIQMQKMSAGLDVKRDVKTFADGQNRGLEVEKRLQVVDATARLLATARRTVQVHFYGKKSSRNPH